MAGRSDVASWIEKFRALDVASNDCNSVRIIERQVGIYEDEKIGDSFGEW